MCIRDSLYICGVGNVGSKLIQQIYSQNKYLNENLLMNLRVAGLTNSTKMVFNDQGIQENEFKDALHNGEPSTPHKFAEEIINRNLRNSVFVDAVSYTHLDVYKRQRQTFSS